MNPPNKPIKSQALSNAERSPQAIKIEKSDVNGVFTDATQEILNYGIAPNAARFLRRSDPNAIIRLQRLRDNAGHAATNGVLQLRHRQPTGAMTRPTGPNAVRHAGGGVPRRQSQLSRERCADDRRQQIRVTDVTREA